MKRNATTDAMTAAGYKAAVAGQLSACALCQTYRDATDGHEVGNPLNRVYANAWYLGYRRRVDEDCAKLFA